MKPGGVKVRCSKCKHVFQASPDGASDGPTATGTPMPAAESGGGGAGGDHAKAPSYDEAQQAASENLSMGIPADIGDLGPPPISPSDSGPAPGDAFGIGPPAGSDLGGIAPPDMGPPDIAPPAVGPADFGPPSGAGSGPALTVDGDRSISMGGGDERGPTPGPPAAVGSPRAGAPDLRAAAMSKQLATRSSLGMLLFMTLLAFNGVCMYVLYKNEWRADLRRAGDMFRVAVDAEEEVMLPVAKPAVPRLEIPGAHAKSLQNDDGRALFIIDGVAKNVGDVAVKDVLIAGRLLDSKRDDKVVRRATAPATGRIDPDAIRAIRSLADVQRAYKHMKRRGSDDGVLAPGASAAFTVVFPDLPEGFLQDKQRYRWEVQLGAYEQAHLDGAPSKAGPKTAKKSGDDDPEGQADDADQSDESEASGVAVEEFMGPPAPG